MRDCRGEVELRRGALEQRRRGGGVTTVSGVSTTFHVVQNSGRGRKNGRGGPAGRRAQARSGDRHRRTSGEGGWRSAKQGARPSETAQSVI
jgi:hypothetical protein